MDPNDVKPAPEPLRVVQEFVNTRSNCVAATCWKMRKKRRDGWPGMGSSRTVLRRWARPTGGD